jgi:bacteriorhodopsin
VIALVRPDSWDFPLFVHVLGAVALFGGVATLVLLSFAGLRIPEHAPLLRTLAFRTMLMLVWPAYVVMRVGAQWILSREGLDNAPPGWVGFGFAVSDLGIVVLLVLTLLGWLALRRRPGVAPYFAGLASLYLVALGVAWWAMSAKPGS